MPSQLTYNIDPDIAVTGLIAGDHDDVRAYTRFNAEASANIPFGYAVKYGTLERDALLPSAATSKLQGIVMRTQAMEESGPFSELVDNSGVPAVKPSGKLSVAHEGIFWVVCEDGCNPGDRLHVRWETGTDTKIGSLRSTADSTHTIDCSNNGKWLSVATAGNVAKLQIDFTAMPGTPTAGN